MSFFRVDDGLDQFFAFQKLGIRFLVHVDNNVDKIGEKCFFYAEDAAEADGAAQNTAKHVAPAFVTGQNTVADHHGYGANVVANDLHGDLLLRIRIVTVTYIDYSFHEREEQVRFKVRIFLLNNRSQSF